MTTNDATAKAQEADDIISTRNDCQCHMLPCKIEFTGRAPVEVYFSPHLVSGQGTTNEANEDSEGQGDRVYGSQFRGRQLLATDPYQPSTGTIIQGRLLEVDAHIAKSSEDRVQVKGKFTSVLEWKHESDPAVLRNSSSNQNSRVRAAMKWFDVAHAVSSGCWHQRQDLVIGISCCSPDIYFCLSCFIIYLFSK